MEQLQLVYTAPGNINYVIIFDNSFAYLLSWTYYPVVLLLLIYLVIMHMYIHQNTCIRIFRETVFVIDTVCK